MFRALKFFFIVVVSISGWDLSALELIHTPRYDTSLIKIYLSTPQEQNFPIIFLIQGSDLDSVISNHETLAQRFLPYGIALLSIEKRGISSSSINNQEFIEHDFFEERMNDLFCVCKALEEGLIPKWNGKLIFLGGSEGGKIVPKLSLQFSNHVLGTILVGAGGGIPFAEEMKFQIQTELENQNPILKICSKIRNVIFPKEIDSQMIKILSQPTSLEIWCNKTFRWWASYLKYDPLPELIQIDTPIYMIHGALDQKVPVTSSDYVKAAFDHHGKHNLTYMRYGDLGHAIKGREDVYRPMMEWIKLCLSNIKRNYETDSHD